jgi:taurine--2-oxoglutarate transaminase
VVQPNGNDAKGVMKDINARLADRGFMTYTHENIILAAPPLIITADQLREELGKLDEVLSYIDSTIYRR